MRPPYTTIAAFDGKYRINDLELAGEYMYIYQDNPGSLGTDAKRPPYENVGGLFSV